MKFIGLLLLAMVITFGLISLGYWMRVLHELYIKNKIPKKQMDFLVFIAVLGFLGIILALTGMFLL